MLALVAMLLSQVPAAPCNTDGGLFNADCSYGGFRSYAGLFYGSGAPDFACGFSDVNADGTWGAGSKYCLFRTEETGNYNGSHPDFTISSLYPRSAGNLFGVENSYWSPGYKVFWVDFAGNVYSGGRFYAYGNGAGIQNSSAYVGVRGQSTTPGVIGDVMLAPAYEHHDGGWVVDVWNGPTETLFRVRDDGALKIGGQVLRVTTNSDALYIKQELPDGGERVAVITWAQ